MCSETKDPNFNRDNCVIKIDSKFHCRNKNLQIQSKMSCVVTKQRNINIIVEIVI